MKSRMNLWLAIVVGVLVLWVLCDYVKADIRINLLTRLDEYMDDADNYKMTSANKLIYLQAVGRDLSRLGLYYKRDTIILAAGTETYAANSDFAGLIKSAYIKTGNERTVLAVANRDSVFKSPAEAGDLTRIFIEHDGYIGFDPVAISVDTVILVYAAHPASLAGDSTEWSLPDHFEDAALRLTASRCLMKLPTSTAQEKASILYQSAWADLDRFMNPMTLTIKAGETPR